MLIETCLYTCVYIYNFFLEGWKRGQEKNIALENTAKGMQYNCVRFKTICLRVRKERLGIYEVPRFSLMVGGFN